MLINEHVIIISVVLKHLKGILTVRGSCLSWKSANMSETMR